MKIWLCSECAFLVPALGLEHCRSALCKICKRECSSDPTGAELDGDYYSPGPALAGWRREHEKRVDAELTIARLSAEQDTCFKLLKPFSDNPHVDQTLPKFLSEVLYPKGGRLVVEFIGPEFDWEEAGNCDGLPCEGLH